MEYKLIKEYPGSPALGVTVSTNKDKNIDYFDMDTKDHTKRGKHYPIDHEIVENNPEHWEKVKEIPEWVICTREVKGFNGILNMLYKLREHASFSASHSIEDNPITGETGAIKKDMSKEATPAEVEAHKLGFHIGDKIWNNSNKKYLGIIKEFRPELGLYCITDSSDALISLITNKEPKLITEEGDKLYGDDKCWYVTTHRTKWSDSMYRNFTGGSVEPEHKYFSKKSNAQQYFAELQAKQNARGTIGCPMGINSPTAKLHIKGSDLDIDKTCETCRFEDSSEYSNNCSSCATLHRDFNWQPKEPKFEVGKWYKLLTTPIHGLYDGLDNKGFDIDEWSDYITMRNPTQWKPADMNKVKELLLAEAKKRYPKGTKFKPSNRKFVQEVGISVPVWNTNVTPNILIIDGIGTVYEEGKWAEIIGGPKLMLGDVAVKITDHEVVTSRGKVLIGEWLTWYEQVTKFYTLARTGEIGLKLSSYNTLSVKGGTTEIGCIKDVTWQQLKAVTKAINEL